MKRFGQIEIITAVIMIVTSLAGPAGAEISWSGDVDPSDPSTWDSSTIGRIGNTGNGTMSITGGSDVIDYIGLIGVYSSGTGEVTVDGAGSTWTTTTSGELDVGFSGNGTLNITDGGVVSNPWGYIGTHPGSTGEVTVDGAGSKLTNRGRFYVGNSGRGTLNITDGGLVSVAGPLTIDTNGDDDSFINMATGGMLALRGDGGGSLAEFLGLIAGTDAIRYWDSSIAGWANITGATMGLDYTLEYLTEGDLAGYTMLTVPEPATMLLLCMGGMLLRRKQ